MFEEEYGSLSKFAIDIQNRKRYVHKTFMDFAKKEQEAMDNDLYFDDELNEENEGLEIE